MGLTKKIGAATNSRKNNKKVQKKTGGELICKKFGVNGKASSSIVPGEGAASEE